jgi:hypothetical protein
MKVHFILYVADQEQHGLLLRCAHQAAYCLDPDGHVLAFATSADADLSAVLEQDSTNDQQ